MVGIEHMAVAIRLQVNLHLLDLAVELVAAGRVIIGDRCAGVQHLFDDAADIGG